MGRITAVLNLQGRSRRNALIASRAMRLRRLERVEAADRLGPKPPPLAGDGDLPVDAR